MSERRQYTLTVDREGYSIRIEREGHGQTIPHGDLVSHRGGVNVINAVCRLIEDKIAGRVK